MILSKMGIKMTKEDAEALKQSADETHQILADMGKPQCEGTPPKDPPPDMSYGGGGV